MTRDRSAPQVHPQAVVETPHLGAGARVGPFTHVLPGAHLGPGCRLAAGVVIEEDARIEEGATIGANATVRRGLRVGQGAAVASGAVVTRDVPPNARVAGNPAIIEGYEDAPRPKVQPTAVDGPPGVIQRSKVAGVTVHLLRRAVDLRGSLAVGEVGPDCPFPVRRFFLVYDVPSAEARGEHAHRVCDQFLVCVKGSISVVVDDGTHREEFVLDRPNLGLRLPPRVFGTQYGYTADAVLLVLASHPYDPADYVRTYAGFLALVRETGAKRPGSKSKKRPRGPGTA